MKRKIIQILLLILAFACWGLSAWQSAVCNDMEMLMLHMGLTVILAYFIPAISTDEELYLVAYIGEILIGLVAFLWVYINVFYENFMFPSGGYGIIFIDGFELMITGLCVALICIVVENREIARHSRKLQK